MSGYKDGFKRGTNYCHRMAGQPDPAAEVAAYASQEARCAGGEHDETVARKGSVTYLAFGRRVPPGTRYCRCCSVILAGETP